MRQAWRRCDGAGTVAVRVSACAELHGARRCGIVHLLMHQDRHAVQSPQHLTHILRGPDSFGRELIIGCPRRFTRRRTRGRSARHGKHLLSHCTGPAGGGPAGAAHDARRRTL